MAHAAAWAKPAARSNAFGARVAASTVLRRETHRGVLWLVEVVDGNSNRAASRGPSDRDGIPARLDAAAEVLNAGRTSRAGKILVRTTKF